jgi:hypothetical protein
MAVVVFPLIISTHRAAAMRFPCEAASKAGNRIVSIEPKLTPSQSDGYATILTSIAARVKNIMQALALAERHS